MLRQPRVRLPLPLVITFLGIILLCMIIMSLGIGARSITPPDVLAALRHYGDPTNSHIIWGRRIPRTLIAIAAGASLSLAGVLIQALTRNPLADTGVFGINAGAAFTIVVGIAPSRITKPHQHIRAGTIRRDLSRCMRIRTQHELTQRL